MSKIEVKKHRNVYVARLSGSCLIECWSSRKRNFEQMNFSIHCNDLPFTIHNKMRIVDFVWWFVTKFRVATKWQPQSILWCQFWFWIQTLFKRSFSYDFERDGEVPRYLEMYLPVCKSSAHFNLSFSSSPINAKHSSLTMTKAITKTKQQQ